MMPPKRPHAHMQPDADTRLSHGEPRFSALRGLVGPVRMMRTALGNAAVGANAAIGAAGACAANGVTGVVLAAVLGVLLLSGCYDSVAGKGGGTETESKVAGRAVDPQGNPSVGARVILRPADYLADPVSSEDVSKRRQETVTDAQGRYAMGGVPAGDYRIEIAGAESGGAIRDFSLAHDSEGVKLAVDSVKPRGSILGSFAPDSEAQLASFVQVFGLERLVKADPSGGFILYNLPEGVYDIRCSSLQPFRRDAVRRGIKVASGQQTVLDPIALAKEAKLAFSVDSIGLKIVGLDSTNPVILDNERWDNGPENEYIWAKASMGSLDLRGNIATQDLQAPLNTQAAQLAAGRGELRTAHLAGLAGIPDLVAGATARLSLPGSDRIEDIKPTASAGSDLIVAEARKATPEKPLLVVVGGPLTTVAQAYLTDPSIAPRMVVAGIFTYDLQAVDSVANYLVAKKCRFLQWGRTYTWQGKPDTTRFKDIPLSRMGERLRGYLAGNTSRLSFGDLAPVAYLFQRGLWKSAQMVKVSSKIEVQPASDITFDFLDIPATANDWQRYNDEFYSTLANPRAYAPKPLPASIEGEAYNGKSGTGLFVLDSAAGTFGVSMPVTTWTEYRVTAAVAGRFAVKLRYRSGAGGRMSIGIGDQALAEGALPASMAFTDAALDSISLPQGITVLRATATEGKIDLTGIDLN